MKPIKDKYGIETLLNINLTPTQREYIGAFKWMLDTNNIEYIGTGRTFLIAVVYIGLALEHRNKWIHVIDHYDLTLSSRHNIFNKIVELINRNKNLLNLVEFNPINKSFRAKE